MSELKKCDRCQRSYHLNVYQRHINENQCLKRNQQRVPFQSIKQRTIRIGDRIFSVASENSNAERTTREVIVQEKKKKIPPAPKNPSHPPSHSRRQTLEQAKELLARRTKYQPAWIQKRSNPHPQPILTQSPKQILRSFNPHPILPPIDRTFTQDVQTPSTRKAKTWTRSTKLPSHRQVVSPINIPTCLDYSTGPSQDRHRCPKEIYDEFERYSPTRSSTPPRPISYKKTKLRLPPLRPWR